MARAVAGIVTALALAAPAPIAAQHEAPRPAETAGSSADLGTSPAQSPRAGGDGNAGVQGGRSRIAVLILGTGEVAPSTADALTEAALAEVAAEGRGAIIGKEELQARLGYDEQRTLQCVSSTSCLGRIGVELGVTEIVAGTIGRKESRWIFHLDRIDIGDGQLVRRAFDEVHGDLGALTVRIQQAVETLYEQRAPPTATLRISADPARTVEVYVDGKRAGVQKGTQALVIEGLAPGAHELSLRVEGHRAWSRTVRLEAGGTRYVHAAVAGRPRMRGRGVRISPLAWVGTGALLAAGTAGVYFGQSSQNTLESNTDRTRAEALRFIEARERDARIANAMFGVAAAGALTAVIGLLRSDFGEPRGEQGSATRVWGGPTRGGLMLGVGGEL